LTPAELAAAAPAEWRTPRLLLRAAQAGDGGLLMDLFNASLPAYSFIHWAQARDGRPFTRADADGVAGRLQGYHERGESLHYLVLRTDTPADAPETVGLLDLHSFALEVPRAELGYVGDLRQSGQGLVREAVLALTDMAFGLGFVRVQALSDSRNTRALQFADSLSGFRREGVLRAFERDPWGELSEQVMFAALRPSPSHESPPCSRI
jgi:RimJ/RimL family protein N-acetyltransferase